METDIAAALNVERCSHAVTLAVAITHPRLPSNISSCQGSVILGSADVRQVWELEPLGFSAARRGLWMCSKDASKSYLGDNLKFVILTVDSRTGSCSD